MIFIDLFGNPPPQDLIDEGTELTRQLMGLPPDKRNDFIDKYDDYWGKLKDYYAALSHDKCWYRREIALLFIIWIIFGPKSNPKN